MMDLRGAMALYSMPISCILNSGLTLNSTAMVATAMVNHTSAKMIVPRLERSSMSPRFRWKWVGFFGVVQQIH